VVGRGGRAVLGGVGHLLVRLPARLLVAVVVAVAVAAVVVPVAGWPRRRLVAEQVVEQAPDPVHRKGL
jgi:hypothetical protein